MVLRTTPTDTPVLFCIVSKGTESPIREGVSTVFETSLGILSDDSLKTKWC